MGLLWRLRLKIYISCSPCVVTFIYRFWPGRCVKTHDKNRSACGLALTKLPKCEKRARLIDWLCSIDIQWWEEPESPAAQTVCVLSLLHDVLNSDQMLVCFLDLLSTVAHKPPVIHIVLYWLGGNENRKLFTLNIFTLCIKQYWAACLKCIIITQCISPALAPASVLHKNQYNKCSVC